jgi:hypothetical protein
VANTWSANGAAGGLGTARSRAEHIPYNSWMDYLYAALIFAFMVAVLLMLWKREHPKKN